MEFTEPVKKFLEKPNLAVLATIGPSGRPQATPVWFLLDGDEILMNTSQGRAKLRNVQADPRVAVTIYDKDNPYLYVQVRGRVTIDPKSGARDIDRLSQRYRGKPYQYPPSDAPEKRVSLRLKPSAISGMGVR